jgi:NTE family protein
MRGLKHAADHHIMEYDTLVISGGAIKGLLSLGALNCLHEEGILSKIKTFVGTSVGSIICLMLVLEYKPMELLVYACDDNITSDFHNVDLFRLIDNFGAFEPHTLYKTIIEHIIDKCDRIPTFEELYEMNQRELTMCTYNLTEKRIEYLNRHTHPGMTVMNAIKLSCNIPFLFPRLEYENSFYVDGGVADDFPINYIDDGAHTVMGIYTPYQDKIRDQADIHFADYLYDIIHAPIKELRRIRDGQLSDRTTVIKLYTDKRTMQFNLKRREKMDMFSQGYKQARKHILNKAD